MKEFKNQFVLSGFVGKDATIQQFSTNSLARFPMVVRSMKAKKDNVRTSSVVGVVAWRKNENTSSFDLLRKGELITVQGYFRPQNWTDGEGKQHSRMEMVAVGINPVGNKENPPKTRVKKNSKKQGA